MERGQPWQRHGAGMRPRIPRWLALIVALFGTTPALAQRDSVAEARRVIDRDLAPLDASRREILRQLAADRGSPRADSTFWTWYGGYRVLVDSLTRDLATEFVDVLVDPVGATAQAVLRRRHEPFPFAVSRRQIAVMDSVRALFRAHDVHAMDAEGDVEYAPSDVAIRAEMGPSLGSLSGRVLAVLALEETTPIGGDAAIAISWSELADRLATADDLRSHQLLPAADTLIQGYYRSYLVAYLGAWDNTPGFDFNPPHELLPALRASYERYVRAHSTTESGRIIQAYVELLRAHDWKRAPEIDEFIRRAPP
jgi:hypothetical protein